MKSSTTPNSVAEHAVGRLARAFEQALHRRRALVRRACLELAVDLAARGLFAEDEAGDGDDDEQQRRDREDRVEGQRRAHALRVVVDPVHGGRLEQAARRP